MGFSGYTHVDVDEIVTETDKAFLVIIDGNEPVWIPKSAVAGAGDWETGDQNISLPIADWLCEKIGIGA